MKIFEKVMYGLYILCGGMYLFDIIYCKDMSKISALIWVINTVIMYTCARMNEKRADKYSELYFDLMEKDFEKEYEKYKELIKNNENLIEKR